MRTPHFSLLLLVLLSAGCVYYPADPYVRRPRYRHYPPSYYNHRVYPHRDEDQPIETDPDGPGDPQHQEVPPPPDETQTAPPPPPVKLDNSAEVPTAARTSKAGRVKNPFQPGQELDVSGLPSGSLAKDPATGKVFKVP